MNNPAPSSATPRRVALIFDDGPHEIHGPRFLDLFAREQIRVSFAHVGKNAVLYPDRVRAAHRAGHEIVNHSYTHPHFSELTPDAMNRELGDTQQLIASLTGAAPRMFWAPYGDKSELITRTVNAAGLSCLPMEKLNFVSVSDWDVKNNAETIYERATAPIKDPSVICFHEWREETLAVMPRIIANLKGQGCSFLTFSGMLAV